MSFGIGAFPFGFFASNFNFGEERPGAPGHGSHQGLEEAFLHKVFLWVGLALNFRLISNTNTINYYYCVFFQVAFAFIFWLLIA